MRKIILLALSFILLATRSYAIISDQYELADRVSIQRYSSNLTTALSRIGSSHKTLDINTTVTLAADANVPENLALSIGENGLITLGNYNLYVHGDFDCPPGNQAFWVYPNKGT